MKKFLAILLASASALTVCAFTACGETKEEASDVVTQAEWVNAFMSSKFLNVTVECDFSESYTYNDGTTETAEGSGVIKNAFTLSGSNITGNGYMYSSYYSDGSSGSYTYYETFGESAYSYVEKDTGSYGESWYGNTYSSAGTTDDSDNYSELYGIISNFINEYSDFEYVDGAYKYEKTHELKGSDYYESLNNTYYIKINDGYITSLIWEENDYNFETNYSTNSTSREEYTFSGYGTTTVTIPTEYTYAYYLQHNV